MTVLQHTCNNCPYGGIKVSHKGPIDSPLVIIGEGPSPIELANKTIFIGPINELLQTVLEQSGFLSLGIAPLYINALECFPRDKKTGVKKTFDKAGKLQIVDGGKKKLAQAITSCRNRLIDTITAHPRKMILALGATALHGVTGDQKLKITQERGGLIVDGYSDKGTFVIVHPTTILKGGSTFKQFKDDFDKAFEIYHGAPFSKYTDPTYEILGEPKEVRALVQKIKDHGKNKGLVSADIETGGFNFWEDEILELGISLDGKHVYVIPDWLLIWAKDLFQNNCQWIWHNGKFDIKFLWEYGIDARVNHDTMLISYALNEVGGIHNLEQVSWDWLGAPDYKHMIKPYLQNKDSSYREIPAPLRRKYAAFDVGRTFQLFAPMYKALCDDPILLKNYNHILIPGSNYLARVEHNGFMTDRTWVKARKEEMETELAGYQVIFQEMAVKSWGKEVNTNSPTQLKDYLYGHLKLAHPAQSTDRDTLEDLPPHECLEPLLKIRRLQKSLSTYIYPCWNKVDYKFRIHATYNLHGTKTGRLSSNGPNMQNIPRLQAVRGMFIAAEGKILIECDLSQAELRSLAQLSGDDELCRIYNSDEMSLHDEVTKEIWPEYQTEDSDPIADKELKMRGKAVNFGIVYGRQAFSFVAEFLISVGEANRWINRWFERFPKAARFIKRCREAVDKGETLVTVFGRKRRFGVITPERRQKLQNEASNFPHQSTASDITLLAGIRIEPIIRLRFGAKVVNTVHDCIVIEAYPQYKDAICKLVTETMQAIPREWGLKRVPFLSEAETGERWGHLKGYHGFQAEGLFICPTCGSSGFDKSLISEQCSFCDGTEGGHPPTEEDISNARNRTSQNA